MASYPFVTLDVFTDTRFGGNPLAVFTDARGLTDAQMQSLAAEMNLSETTFILPPQDPANTARVRIFNRTAEMPFAGHPSVGTGWVLSQMGKGEALRLEVPAGIVEVSIEDGGGVIAAPQALSLGVELPVERIAACAGLTPADIVVTAHRPVEASVGVTFVIAQVTPEALGRAAPDLSAFRRGGVGLPRVRRPPVAAPLRRRRRRQTAGADVRAELRHGRRPGHRQRQRHPGRLVALALGRP